jgi:hypothetical protein
LDAATVAGIMVLVGHKVLCCYFVFWFSVVDVLVFVLHLPPPHVHGTAKHARRQREAAQGEAAVVCLVRHTPIAALEKARCTLYTASISNQTDGAAYGAVVVGHVMGVCATYMSANRASLCTTF